MELSIGVPVPRDLVSCLVAGARTFEDMRYAYEDNYAKIQFFLMELPPILRACITEEKPEWMARHLPREVPLVP
jgi:hypothetical protein